MSARGSLPRLMWCPLPGRHAAAVEVVDLVKSYGARRAVDGLSLTVERGTLLALLGPNGAGKTTTIEICEGFRRADAGVVRVLGLAPDAADAAPAGRRDAAGRRRRLPRGPRAGTAASCSRPTPRHPHDPGDLLELVGLTERRRHRGEAAVRRPAAAAVARAGARRPSGAGVPRRADRRHGPAGPARHLGPHRAAAHATA